MEKLHHELWIVQLVNAIFGPIVAAAARPFGIEFVDGAKVIPDHVVMAMLIVVLFLVLGLAIRSRLSVEHPSKFQIVLEDIVGWLVGMLRDNIGDKGPRFLPLVGTIFLFIFTANMFGKIPGLMAPTASLNTTVGCAITVWMYYHYQGIKAQGLGKYLLHFAVPPGSPVFMAPIMLPIEVISHLSRMLSLSLRLFGNVFGEEMVVLILASILPFIAPLPMMLLGIITGSLQAFIFALLTTIYLAGAVHTEEHEEHHEAHVPEDSHAHAVA